MAGSSSLAGNSAHFRVCGIQEFSTSLNINSSWQLALEVLRRLGFSVGWTESCMCNINEFRRPRQRLKGPARTAKVGGASRDRHCGARLPPVTAGWTHKLCNWLDCGDHLLTNQTVASPTVVTRCYARTTGLRTSVAATF